ncbi:hypothetical protein ABFZ85_10905 [Hyphococcus formosus]|uniref:hypothetical protein n=1 Tax=Hyphococcus formosus TaxID=3143534 RepID=UPI00398B9FDF
MKEILNQPAIWGRNSALQRLEKVTEPTGSRALTVHSTPLFYANCPNSWAKSKPHENKLARVYQQTETRASQFGPHALDRYV